MNVLRQLTLGLGLAGLALASAAGTASGVFEVRITLNGAVVLPPVAPVTPVSPITPVDPAQPPVGGGHTPPPTGGPGIPGSPLPVDPGAPTTPGNPGGPSVPPVASAPRPQLMVPGARGTPPGICTGQTLVNGPGATVNVVCSLGQYVTIEPLVRPPFLFDDGGEQRFSFGPASPLPRSLGGRLNSVLPVGTVTALRILDISALASPLEMLVSF